MVSTRGGGAEPAARRARRGRGRAKPRDRRAWSGDPPQRAAARERLLDATAACIAERGVAGTGIATVAAAAGVSRPTVYRYFADRGDLVQASLLRIASDLSRRMTLHVAAVEAPGEQMVEAVMFVLREIPRDPVLSRVWDEVAIDPTVLRGFTGPRSIALCREAFASLVEAAGWDDETADEAIEVALRLLLSLLAAPEPRRTPARTRAFLRRRLLPALGLTEA